jgi:hypothetical protein
VHPYEQDIPARKAIEPEQRVAQEHKQRFVEAIDFF